jgi:predicted cation transporter
LDAFAARRNPDTDSIAMNPAVGVALIALLLVGPVVSRAIEERIEIFFLAIGLLAMTLAGAWRWEVASRAAQVPLGITLAVIVADVVFGRVRGLMDRALGWIQARVARPLLCGGAVFVIALLSAMLTAIVAALMLAELVELIRLGPRARLRVTVAGCFAIGLGSSLTPLGGPLSTLAASGLGMGFGGLFAMLAPYVLPGMLACAIVAGLFASSDDGASAAAAAPTVVLIRESVVLALLRGLEVYVFIAGLVLVGVAFAPLAARYVPMLGRSALYWANTISAAMDNATLVALEVHAMDPARAREAIIALLVAGGMLIPGNIPNIVAAATLRIGAGDWAKVGIPMGLVLLGIYFALLHVAG